MSTSVTPSPRHTSSSQWRGEGWSSAFTPSPTHIPSHTPSHTSSQWGRAIMKWSTDSVLALTRKWIEECTGCVSGSKSYREYLQDGTVLCKLVHGIQSGLIRKINYLKSPFAWRENLSFFLDACLGLGLKGSQLFSPEDLLVSSTSTHSLYKPRVSSREEDERKLRSVALTIYWLGCRVQEQSDYRGPLLNSDLSVSDLDTAIKSPSLANCRRERSVTSPERINTTTINSPNHTPDHTPNQHTSEVGSPSAEQPVAAGVTQSDSRSSESRSPFTSRLKKVSSVTSLVTKTSDTDKQSFPQVVRFPNHITNSPTTDQHRKIIPIRHTKSEPEKDCSKIPQLGSIEGHSRQLSDSASTIVTTDKIVQEEFEKSRSAEFVHIAEVSSLELARKCTVFESSPQNSQETFEDPRDLEFSSSPSEASTVVLRDPTSSRCSTHSAALSTGKSSELSETESTLNSPLTQDTFGDPTNPELYIKRGSTTSSSQSTANPELEFVQSPVISPPQLSNPSNVSEATAPVDHTGLISLEFCQDLNSNSQETASISLYSPKEIVSEASFQFNLTQQSQNSQDHTTSDLEATVPSPELHSKEESLEKVDDTVEAADKTYSNASYPHSEVLGHIREESSEFQPSSPSVYRVPLNYQEYSTTSPLSTHVRLSASCETFPEARIDSPSIVATRSLKESSVQSGHSSLSSINSSNCSYIVVSYTTRASARQENVADIAATSSDVAAYSNSIDCYYSDVSDDNIDNNAMEISVLNTQNNNFGGSNMISTAAIPCEGHNNKGVDCSSNEFNSTNQIDASSGKLTLYSSSPLSNASHGAVPHHSLSIATSGPDSPSSFQAAEKDQSDVLTDATATARPGYQELTVQMIRLPGEKQLGVSITGGRDEGTCPRVDAITGDSPVARSALQCSDELLAVNGVPLHNTYHSEATTILNEAASKDKIVLRVRRPLESSNSHYPSPPKPPSTSSSSYLPTTSTPYSLPLPHLPTTSTPYSLPLPHFHAQQAAMDLTRVQSDALPSSMHASKIVCEIPDLEPHADAPDFLSDANSMAVEIGSSLDDDLEKVSMSDSRIDIQGEGLDEDVVVRNASMEDKLKQFVLLTKGGKVKEGRPYSAPSRSVSTGQMPLGTSYTLPPNMSGAEINRFKEKRTSVDEQRQKRKANIAESARAAQQYYAKRKSLKRDSLTRDYRSSSLSSKSGYSEDEFFHQNSPSHVRKSSSPAVIARALHQQEDAINNPSSSPLNLRNMSIDDTKEASFSQMAEIWRQVEEGDASEDTDAPPRVEQASKYAAVKQFTVEQENQVDNVKLSLEDDLKDDSTKLDEKEVMENGGTATNEEAVNEGSPSHVADATASERHTRPSYQTQTSEVLETADIVVSLDDSSPRHKATPTVNGSVHDGATLAPPTPEVKRTRAPSFSNKDIDSLLTTLRSLSDHGEEEDLKVLEDMLKSNMFKKAKQVHDSMHSVLLDDSSAIRPVIRRIVPISQLMRQHLHHHTEPSPAVNELRELIRKPHVQAVLFTHDKVSSRDLYVPDRHFPKAAQDPVDIILSGSFYNFQAAGIPIDTSAPLSREVPSSRKEDATIVFLERTNRPLGCTIYKQEDSVFIGKLLKGCDAEQNDVLREGDELLEVNGVPVMQKSTDEIVRLMSGDQAGTTLAFTIIPVHDDNVDVLYEPKYVRAHFNYNGRCDEEIPCKALGLSFSKGDILEISNQDDPHWWQARKVFDDGGESLPGLIPARHLQQQREAMIRSYPFSSAIERKKGFRSIFSKKKKKKIYYQNTPPSNVLGVGDEVVTYEDVAKLESEPDVKRPIILIGAPGVGRRTLIRKLLNHDSSHYAPVVQHTTRGIRPGEVNGHDYYFATRDEFERDVENDRFLEYGELRGHYYGLAFSSIKKVMESGRVPVLDLHPQALKKIRHSGLMPYIIFIASPRLERLRMTRRVGSQKLKRKTSGSGTHMDDVHIYTESDLHHLMEESYLIENQYGHYFDWIIVNDDFQVAADMLKEVSRRLEEEAQWVPYNWTLEQF